jgi:hypothetical protein
MKKLLTIGFGLLILLLVAPLSLYAQSNPPPPPCCGDAPSGLRGEGGGSVGEVTTQIQVTRSLLESQRLTRSQFIDRIADTLFPGKRLDLMYTSTRLLGRNGDRRVALRSNSESEEGLVGVQEKRIYQVSRERMRADEIEKIDQLFLTDGLVFVRISFLDEVSGLE